MTKLHYLAIVLTVMISSSGCERDQPKDHRLAAKPRSSDDDAGRNRSGSGEVQSVCRDPRP
jgi:hypothetical protein